MATAYTLVDALNRAKQRRDNGEGSVSVWQHRYYAMDYIVCTFASGAPVNFNRVATFWDDGTFAAYDPIAQGLGYEA